MFSIVTTCILEGLDGRIIRVETDMSSGLPNFNIVGLAGTSIKESVDRVRTSIANSGYKFPMNRITVNLSPANIRKEGSQIDLSIAIGVLCASNIIEEKNILKTPILGELSLDGKVNKIKGALPIVVSLKKLGFNKCLIPYENFNECNIYKDFQVIPVKTLSDAVNYFKGSYKIPEIKEELKEIKKSKKLDFSDVKGQESLKRALEICAAGGHNILIIGPPGSGKTMAVERLAGILPSLSREESIEVSKIYSISNLLDKDGLIVDRPFRSPHHTTPKGALLGGGRNPKPGEISLAHNGILFLDELPEFKRDVLEVLRQPLEDGKIKISRLNGTVTFPANFILVAAMNPCKCGYYGSKKKECTCSLYEVSKYLNRVSNPFLDRIDLHVEVEEVAYNEVHSEKVEPESSDSIRSRVLQSRKIQKNRFINLPIYTNAEMSSNLIKKYCKLDENTNRIFKIAYEKYNFSLRTHDKILKVSRTIADLEKSKDIETRHLLEALSYRNIKEKYNI